MTVFWTLYIFFTNLPRKFIKMGPPHVFFQSIEGPKKSFTSVLGIKTHKIFKLTFFMLIKVEKPILMNHKNVNN